MSNHMVVLGTTLSELIGTNNYRITLFVREVYCGKQNSK